MAINKECKIHIALDISSDALKNCIASGISSQFKAM